MTAFSVSIPAVLGIRARITLNVPSGFSLYDLKQRAYPCTAVVFYQTPDILSGAVKLFCKTVNAEKFISAPVYQLAVIRRDRKPTAKLNCKMNCFDRQVNIVPVFGLTVKLKLRPVLPRKEYRMVSLLVKGEHFGGFGVVSPVVLGG